MLDLANWLVPGLTRARLFPRQPIERGMNDEDAIKVREHLQGDGEGRLVIDQGYFSLRWLASLPINCGSFSPLTPTILLLLTGYEGRPLVGPAAPPARLHLLAAAVHKADGDRGHDTHQEGAAAPRQ